MDHDFSCRTASLGGHPYWYFVPYQDDIQEALNALRQREFRAGRYNPAMWFPNFPVDLNAPSPGAQHPSIEDALADADADGTRSILDLNSAGVSPGYGVAAALPAHLLRQYFGTEYPTRAMVESNQEFFEDIERGQGLYIIVYEGNQPNEIFFAGYSFD
ncbi:MAG: hypothetical protein WBX25_10745 [Rhodomicrobium sp.]